MRMGTNGPGAGTPGATPDVALGDADEHGGRTRRLNREPHEIREPFQPRTDTGFEQQRKEGLAAGNLLSLLTAHDNGRPLYERVIGRREMYQSYEPTPSLSRDLRRIDAAAMLR